MTRLFFTSLILIICCFLSSGCEYDVVKHKQSCKLVPQKRDIKLEKPQVLLLPQSRVSPFRNGKRLKLVFSIAGLHSGVAVSWHEYGNSYNGGPLQCGSTASINSTNTYQVLVDRNLLASQSRIIIHVRYTSGLHESENRYCFIGEDGRARRPHKHCLTHGTTKPEMDLFKKEIALSEDWIHQPVD